MYNKQRLSVGVENVGVWKCLLPRSFYLVHKTNELENYS